MNAGARDKLIKTLADRFSTHMPRHSNIDWADLRARLASNSTGLRALAEMEATGGEPDVVGRDEATGGFVFYDCAPESPAGRRGLCYDQKALAARKANKPRGSAVGMADSLGIEMLSEAQYRALQELGEFDRKTSSWVRTPDRIRSLGGALFCDRRFDTVFVYHNGAESYYAGRGFRGRVTV
ncbi:MAG: DUF4256 domain-containing protein [Gemmatimonadota bacterium]|jgi:hypothetical protein|nr:DUF4256 domain-containing protein [Gemmatimonadota bacterium]